MTAFGITYHRYSLRIGLFIFIKSLHDKVYFYSQPTAYTLNFIRTIKNNKTSQHFISTALVVFVSVSCYFSTDVLGYKTVALLLLMTVSLSAMLFDILPVLIASTVSAFIWNFFFIPPTFTFHVSNTEDSLMLLLYFVIASVHAVLTFKIRQEEKKSRKKDEKEKSIQLYNILLNSLSHELRTPISTIIGSVDTLYQTNMNCYTRLKQQVCD
jgi:two-component system sensor histidine kinase KdpD